MEKANKFFFLENVNDNVNSGKLENRHFIAYTLERSGVTIKQADSLPITTPDLVWMFTTAIVNDVFRTN